MRWAAFGYVCVCVTFDNFSSIGFLEELGGWIITAWPG